MQSSRESTRRSSYPAPRGAAGPPAVFVLLPSHATAPSRHEENGRGAVAPWRPLFMASHFWSHWVASPNDFAFMTQSYCDLVILPTHVSFTFCSVRLSVLTCAFTFST